MCVKLENIQDQIDTPSSTISDVEMALGEKDLPFLQPCVCALGATGFTSGKQAWTVEVGEGKDWYIGVAREPIKRKNAIFLNPTEGFWVIGLCNRDSFWGQTSPRTKLVLKQKPKRIIVQLDCDKGKVAFINADDLTMIHTFKDRFTERIFPYFSPGLYEEGKNSIQLTICPLSIIVDVE
ncbi:hypothetical protein Q8A73_004528 [Channa argus]|nr:hypothetical protein Q8A73_004528 [Channa argus]